MDKRTGRSRTSPALRSPNAVSFYALFLMWAVCSVFYYFGEILEIAHWDALRWQFFYSVHDIHRLVFLAPIIYAAYVFGVKATIILTIISLMALLPRALFVSPYPDPLVRMLVFTLVAGTIGYLTARVREESKRRAWLETLLISERDKLVGILDRMPDGVLVIDPGYRIRYMNASTVKGFGEGVGSPCFQLLQGLDKPCQSCWLASVLAGNIQRRECSFPDGRTYELLASPYRDFDGVVCQLTTIRNTSEHKDTPASP